MLVTLGAGQHRQRPRIAQFRQAIGGPTAHRQIGVSQGGDQRLLVAIWQAAAKPRAPCSRTKGSSSRNKVVRNGMLAESPTSARALAARWRNDSEGRSRSVLGCSATPASVQLRDDPGVCRNNSPARTRSR